MINRRGFIGLGAAAIAAQQVAAAQATTGSIVIMSKPEQPTAQQMESEYKTCLKRGHVAMIFGNEHMTIDDLVFRPIADRPISGYGARIESGWSTCFYCRKQYQFVTTMEER